MVSCHVEREDSNPPTLRRYILEMVETECAKMDS